MTSSVERIERTATAELSDQARYVFFRAKERGFLYINRSDSLEADNFLMYLWEEFCTLKSQPCLVLCRRTESAYLIVCLDVVSESLQKEVTRVLEGIWKGNGPNYVCKLIARKSGGHYIGGSIPIEDCENRARVFLDFLKAFMFSPKNTTWNKLLALDV